MRKLEYLYEFWENWFWQGELLQSDKWQACPWPAMFGVIDLVWGSHHCTHEGGWGGVEEGEEWQVHQEEAWIVWDSTQHLINYAGMSIILVT